MSVRTLAGRQCENEGGSALTATKLGVLGPESALVQKILNLRSPAWVCCWNEGESFRVRAWNRGAVRVCTLAGRQWENEASAVTATKLGLLGPVSACSTRDAREERVSALINSA